VSAPVARYACPVGADRTKEIEKFERRWKRRHHEVVFSAARIWGTALARHRFKVAPAAIVEAAQATGFVSLLHAFGGAKGRRASHHHRDPTITSSWRRQ
jgi:hypothetical protein